MDAVQAQDLLIQPRPVRHTSHPTVGYELQTAGQTVVWPPGFWKFSSWARAADLMFAEAAGWDRPIAFAGGSVGNWTWCTSPRRLRSWGAALVFARLGRPTIRVLDRGPAALREVARDGQVFYLAKRGGQPLD